MIDLGPSEIATAAGAEIVAEGRADSFPKRAVVDSREVGGGELFVGIAGEQLDGGGFAADALSAGAWGTLVDRTHGEELRRPEPGQGWVLAPHAPTAALGALARHWRRRIGCPTVGITGSTGKTSVKDICRAILPRRVHASPENFNTEVGLPLAILAADRDTELLILEMAMRGVGQIAELCEIAEPDVGAITNVGPVHLELLGTLEAIAEAKAEILQGLGPRGRAVVPEDAEALAPHLDDELIAITFGPGGEVFAAEHRIEGEEMVARIGTPHGEAEFRLPFTEVHNLTNALCAVAIGVALDLDPAAMAERAPRIAFSRLRGERVALRGGILLLNDCYNANPISMRAALEHLGSQPATGRRIAVLGGMAELGPNGADYHDEVAALARAQADLVIGVGELARAYAAERWVADPDSGAELLADLLGPGDVALVKGSRSVGLERLTDGLRLRLGEEDGG